MIDTPLAEAGIIGIAIGMALHGLLPVAEIQFADFIHPAFDQIVSEAARIRYRSNGDFGVPMVVRAPCGGGIHGALYHSQSIEAFYAHIPGLKVVVPSTPADAAGHAAERRSGPRPGAVPRAQEDVPADQGRGARRARTSCPIGLADVKREGDDLTVRRATGYSLHLCLEAAERLPGGRGRLRGGGRRADARARSTRETILASVRKTGKAMVVYEDNRTYGAGAEIAATIAEEAMFDLDAPIVRIGGPDIPAMAFASTARALLHGARAGPDLRAHARARPLLRHAPRSSEALAPPTFGLPRPGSGNPREGRYLGTTWTNDP